MKMKTLPQKTNVLAKAFSLTLLLYVFTSSTFASENLSNAADTGLNKYNINKSENLASGSKLSTSERINANYEKELNAITNRISEAIKFRATPLDFDVNTNDNKSDLDIITEEVANSVKFQPAIIL